MALRLELADLPPLELDELLPPPLLLVAQAAANSATAATSAARLAFPPVDVRISLPPWSAAAMAPLRSVTPGRPRVVTANAICPPGRLESPGTR